MRGRTLLTVQVTDDGCRLEVIGERPDLLELLRYIEYYGTAPVELRAVPSGGYTVLACPSCGEPGCMDGQPPVRSAAAAPANYEWWYTGFACANPECAVAGAPIVELRAAPADERTNNQDEG